MGLVSQPRHLRTLRPIVRTPLGDHLVLTRVENAVHFVLRRDAEQTSVVVPVKILRKHFAVETSNLRTFLAIPHLRCSVSRIHFATKQYADADATIKSATGLNSTNVTFLRWPVSVKMGSLIFSSGPPSGNSHNYLSSTRRESTIIVRSAEELIICSSLKGLKSKSHRSPLK